MTALELLNGLIDDAQDSIWDLKDTICRLSNGKVKSYYCGKLDCLKEWQQSLKDLRKEMESED